MSDIKAEDMENYSNLEMADLDELNIRYRFDVTDSHKRIFALAMQGLFEVEVGNISPSIAAADVVPGDCPEDMRKAVRQMVEGAAAEVATLDDILRRHLTCKWTVERLGSVERNVLRLGIYIISHQVWSSSQHVRDLAANCAAEYSNDKSHSLVLAILDAVAREQQKQQA